MEPLRRVTFDGFEEGFAVLGSSVTQHSACDPCSVSGMDHSKQGFSGQRVEGIGARCRS